MIKQREKSATTMENQKNMCYISHNGSLLNLQMHALTKGHSKGTFPRAAEGKPE